MESGVLGEERSPGVASCANGQEQTALKSCSLGQRSKTIHKADGRSPVGNGKP